MTVTTTRLIAGAVLWAVCVTMFGPAVEEKPPREVATDPSRASKRHYPSGAEEAHIDGQLDELAKYYTFALKPPKRAQAECISLKIQPRVRYICIRSGRVEAEAVLRSPKADYLLSEITLKDSVLRKGWKEMADYDKFKAHIISVSSYMGVMQFVRRFSFGQSTWMAYMHHIGDPEAEESEEAETENAAPAPNPTDQTDRRRRSTSLRLGDEL